MSDPEIARRCLRCGAAVRARAQFCPQCGAPMTGMPMTGMVEKKEQTVEPSRRIAPEADDGVADKVIEVKETKPQRAATSAGRPRMIVARGEGARPSRKQQAGERIGRVRDQSLVVLDEAADDPSLRLVLVAFLLFAVFVVLLLLSLAVI